MSDQPLNEKGKMPNKFSVKSGDKSKAVVSTRLSVSGTALQMLTPA